MTFATEIYLVDCIQSGLDFYEEVERFIRPEHWEAIGSVFPGWKLHCE